MRVLFMTNIPSPYRVDFFNALGEKCDLTVLFENETAKSRDAAWRADDVINFNPVFLKGIRTGDAEALCPNVVHYLNRNKFDLFVVGMYSSPTGMLAIEWMRMNKIPFVLSTDGGIRKPESELKHKFKAHFIGSATAWLSTGAVTNKYLEYYGADLSKTTIYPFTSVRRKDVLTTCIDKKEKEKIKRKLGITESKAILSVGQFIHRKGYDLLLNAIRSCDPDVGVYIVGGKATKEYLALKNRYNLGNVHFVDFMSKNELAEYYKSADVFVLPTREDIWGLVINEAMAYGLPVVTTDKCVAGIEMIRENRNGAIVQSENIIELSKAINHVLQNSDWMSREALKTAETYTIENMAKAHIELFQQIIKDYNKGIRR